MYLFPPFPNHSLLLYSHVGHLFSNREWMNGYTCSLSPSSIACFSCFMLPSNSQIATLLGSLGPSPTFVPKGQQPTILVPHTPPPTHIPSSTPTHLRLYSLFSPTHLHTSNRIWQRKRGRCCQSSSASGRTSAMTWRGDCANYRKYI